MKKTRTKETFIEACNKQMANITDPKRVAARRCRAGMKAYKLRERRAKTAKAKERKHAKS